MKISHTSIIVSGIILLFAGMVPIARVHAAVLSVVTQNTVATQNQPVHITVMLNTQGQSANTVTAELVFPPSAFDLEEVEDGSSTVSLWITPPAEVSPGVIDFAGIIPDGFSGVGPLASFDLRPIVAGEGVIQIATATVLANDGQGTSLPVALGQASISIAPSVTTSTPTAPTLDYIAPNPFVPEVVSNPNIFGGKYFLVFYTTDNGSGIDHYEVLEVPSGGSGKPFSSWQTATSPYLLTDQSLSSDIYVRAVDHSGNFIVVKVPARYPSGRWNIPGSWIVVIVIVFFVILLWIWDRRRRHQ